MNENTAQTTLSTHLAEFGRQIAELAPAFTIPAAVMLFGLIAAGIAYLIFKNRAANKQLADAERQAAKLDKNWHALAPQGVLAELKTTAEHGLSSEEIERRRAQYGPNLLPQAKSRCPLLRFIVQFHNLLIYVLLGTAAITAALGHWVDTAVILGVVLINSTIGFVQEGKAEDALAAIRNMLSSQAMVLRNGKRFAIPAEELVPGDIVLLQSGDKTPADLRLLSTKNLQIQEAALTGESVPVAKRAEAVAENAVIGDRLSMAFSGTLVTAGAGSGVVVATGAGTQIGHISTLVAQVETLTTPLLRQMAVFARWITAAVLTLSGLIFIFGIYVRHDPPVEMFMTVVGLAVAGIPEGLPAILTVTLAIGVQSLAARNAIIRRLPVVETLGAVSVICSDKTGTLTRNEMTVRALVTADERFEVTGTGYDPEGRFLKDGRDISLEEDPILSLALHAAIACNDSSVEKHGDEWRVHGDPMEAALLIAAMKGDIDVYEIGEASPRIDVIPFESEHKYMAALHHTHTGEAMIFLKGAPEKLLQLCTRQRSRNGDEPIDAGFWHGEIEHLAQQGQRVLGIAYKTADRELRELTPAALDDGMVLLGLFGLIDPPREEAIAAVRECQAAGIRVKMITGDHSVTACSIAAQLGLLNAKEAITGQDLDRISADELHRRVQEVDVYARVSPEHKLHLVSLLQDQGAIVAMTGDGVNDAPALRRADVGIAMGRKGTEAAKEASEMVITDDNFASIVHAVKEGRTVYENLKKAIVFLLPVNGGESMSLIAAIVFGVTLPITPLQILWVNMVSSVGLAMALAFDTAEPDSMSRPPRPATEAILSGFLLWRIVLVSMLFATGVFGIFSWSQQHGSTLEEARTYAVNTLVVMEVFYLLSVRYLRVSALSIRRLFNTRAIIAAIGVVVSLQLIFTYAPFMEALFDTRPVDFTHALEIAGIGLALFAILEAEKKIRVHFFT
jgi:magnesium-transporting ATPase (P-type)